MNKLQISKIIKTKYLELTNENLASNKLEKICSDISEKESTYIILLNNHNELANYNCAIFKSNLYELLFKKGPINDNLNNILEYGDEFTIIVVKPKENTIYQLDKDYLNNIILSKEYLSLVQDTRKINNNSISAFESNIISNFLEEII